MKSLALKLFGIIIASALLHSLQTQAQTNGPIQLAAKEAPWKYLADGSDQGASTPNIVTIEAKQPQATEMRPWFPNFTPILFALHREGSVEQPLAVAYAVGGTASNGIDYAELSGLALFEAGASNATIAVLLLDDDLVEGTETVEIHLLEITFQGTSQPSPYLVGTPGMATAYILDDETPPPLVSITALDPYASEKPLIMSSVDDAVILVTRSGDASQALEVPFVVSGSASPELDYRLISALDHLLSSGKITFPAGATNATLLIDPIYDTLAEGTETVVIQLLPLPPGSPVLYTLAQPSSATAYIKDFDAGTNVVRGFLKWEVYENVPGRSLSDLTNNPVFPDQPSAVSYITSFETPSQYGDNYGARVSGYLLPPSTGEYIFYLACDDQGALLLSPDELPEHKVQIIFEPEWTPSRQWFTAPKSQPIHLEAGQRYYIEALQKEGGGGDNFAVIWQRPDTAPPADGAPPIPPHFLAPPADYLTNRPPIVTLFASDPEASEPVFDDLGMPLADPGMFAIQREGGLSEPLAVWVNIAGTAANGVDYSEISRRILIPAGEARADVQVWPLTDRTTEDPETVVLSLVANPFHLVGSPNTATVTIDDFTPPPPAIVSVVATDPDAEESGFRNAIFPGQFTISRDGRLDMDLPVYFLLSGTAINGVDYGFITNQAVIPAGQTQASINIFPLNDDLLEGTETVVLTLEPPVCLDLWPPPPGCYRVGPSNQATVFIKEWHITNQPPQITIVTPADGAVFTRHIPILLGANSSSDVTNVAFYANNQLIGRAQGPLRTPDGMWIHWWTNAAAGDYALTARGYSLNGLRATSAPVQIHVQFDQSAFMRGFLSWEVYSNIQGCLVADLTNNPAFPDHPTSSNLVTSFESPFDIDEFYGGRLSGFVLPPETGDYVFYISSDDQGVLFLSPDENPAHKVQIAYEPAWSPPRTWTGPWYGRTNSENVSSPIHLEAGRAYYIEALMKEAFGGDSLGVTWQLPGQPEPFNGESPISGEFLAIRTAQTNLQPSINITQPAEGADFEAPATIQIEALTQNPAGYFNSAEFFANGAKIGQTILTFLVAPPSGKEIRIPFTWTNVAPGSYTLTAHTRNHLGREAVSPPVHITVRETPPPNELHVVGIYSGVAPGGGYSKTNELGEAAVFVDRPGRRVTLFLSAYEPVRWHITSSPNTLIEKVFLVGHYQPQVAGLPPGTEVVFYDSQVGHKPSLWVGEYIESRQFYSALPRVHALTGLEISSFYGISLAPYPNPIVINGVQDDPRLRSDYPQPAPLAQLPANPEFQISFYSAGAGLFQRNYTLAGPQDDTQLLPALPVINDIASDSRYYYGIAGGGSVLEIDSQTGTAREINSKIPGLSWPMGLTYDPEHYRMLLVTLGGEGALYAHYPGDAYWKTIASMENRDLSGLVYHQDNETLYGFSVTSYDGGRPQLYNYSDGGTYLNERPFSFLPFGTGPGYRSFLVSTGKYLVALFAPERAYYPGSSSDIYEERMYLIEPQSGQSWLAYRKVLLPDNQPPTVAITSPNSGATFPVGASISLAATAQDQDGLIQSVQFFANGELLGFGNRSSLDPYADSYVFEWPNAQPGTYSLTARATDNQGAHTDSAPAQITVQSLEPLPVVTITAPISVAKERTRAGDTKSARFKVRRAGATNESLTVYYVIGGTAENGIDYERLEGFITIPAGSRKAFIQLKPVDDSIPEDPETVILTLRSQPSYQLGEVVSAAAVIMDNDSVKPPTGTLPGRLVQVSLSAGGAAAYRVECSTNLRDWVTLQTDAAPQDGAIHFVDPNSPDLSYRFYRAVPVIEPAGLDDE